jgi:hypothetical protein
MELENLKSIWKDIDRPETQQTNEQIIAMLNKRSKSPISRMKRNLMVEAVMVIVLYGFGMLYYFTAFEGNFNAVSWLLLGTGLFFIGYYYKKNKLLNEVTCVTCHVKSNLERQVKMLEKYVRFYLISGTVLAPVMVLFMGALMYIKLPNPAKLSILYVSPTNPLWKVILLWIIFLSVLTAVIYYTNVWYVRKLYGKHIDKLRELLKEIGEVE